MAGLKVLAVFTRELSPNKRAYGRDLKPFKDPASKERGFTLTGRRHVHGRLGDRHQRRGLFPVLRAFKDGARGKQAWQHCGRLCHPGSVRYLRKLPAQHFASKKEVDIG